ncbi:ArnT family glycosyltransferase [Dyadobacter helix]|nr:glycosyltransferase family 39 protein [Dyadobacter sp. CECT 9275]
MPTVTPEENLLLKRYFPLFLIVGIILNMPGLWLDIMEPDGALYATIAKHIVLHNDWVNLIGDGHDWLDKPHFPFWMAAISFKLLGINGFAYKLPAFLFWLAGLRYTFLIVQYLFRSAAARLAVLIYTVALHSTLANFDVRAEPYLTTCILAATWYMLHIYNGKHWIHIVLAAFFMACAIMTKGIFVLISVGGGWLIFLVITQQWSQFTNYKWWLMLLLCFIFILPELYSLYVQFDLHPEKMVFGKTGVSGIRFFFWDSQFGRFFNNGPIKGKGDLSFFFHTTLWAFLPWSGVLVAGVIYFVSNRHKIKGLSCVLYGNTVLTFLLFSLSKFQLPHYIVILFPYFSMVTGNYLLSINNRRALVLLQKFQTGLLLLVEAIVLVLLYYTRIPNGQYAAGITLLLVLIVTIAPVRDTLLKLIVHGYAAAAVVSVFLFLFFYPFLLQYQSGREAARYLKDTTLPVAAYQSFSYSLEFYSPGEVRLINGPASLEKYLTNRPCYLYTTPHTADSLSKAGYRMEVLCKPAYFRITKLKWGFIHHVTRNDVLEERQLLYIKH